MSDKETKKTTDKASVGKSRVVAVYRAKVAARDGSGKTVAAVTIGGSNNVDLVGTRNLWDMGLLSSDNAVAPAKLAARLSAHLGYPVPVIVGADNCKNHLSENNLTLSGNQAILGDAPISRKASSGNGWSSKGDNTAHKF